MPSFLSEYLLNLEILFRFDTNLTEQPPSFSLAPFDSK